MFKYSLYSAKNKQSFIRQNDNDIPQPVMRSNKYLDIWSMIISRSRYGSKRYRSFKTEQVPTFFETFPTN